MNKKGLYSGGIALAAIVMIIAVSFNIASTVQAGESQGKADAILDAKWAGQNVEYLLMEGAVDAMVDEIFVACDYDIEKITPRVKSYIIHYATDYSTIGKINCTASNIDVSGDKLNTLISFDLECSSNAAAGLTINYKKTISFNKTATVTPSSSNCTVKIEDSAELPFGHSVEISGEITG